MIDPEAVLWFNTILLLALLAAAYLTLRRTKKMATQVEQLQELVTALQAQLATAQGQLSTLQSSQTATAASLLAEIARVEALIIALQNQNNPALDAIITSLGTVKDGLGNLNAGLATTVTSEQAEQATADAERPDAPPPA